MNSADDTTDHYEGALLEEINDRLKGIQEGQDSLAHVPTQLNEISDRLGNVESDVKAIKLAFKDQTKATNKDINSLKVRVTALENS